MGLVQSTPVIYTLQDVKILRSVPFTVHEINYRRLWYYNEVAIYISLLCFNSFLTHFNP